METRRTHVKVEKEEELYEKPFVSNGCEPNNLFAQQVGQTIFIINAKNDVRTLVFGVDCKLDRCVHTAVL